MDWTQILSNVLIGLIGSLIGSVLILITVKPKRRKELEAEKEAKDIEFSEDQKDELGIWMQRLLNYAPVKFLEEEVQAVVYNASSRLNKNYPDLAEDLTKYLMNRIVFNFEDTPEYKEKLLDKARVLRKNINKAADDFIRKV